jgi:hypothetical protein
LCSGEEKLLIIDNTRKIAYFSFFWLFWKF